MTTLTKEQLEEDQREATFEDCGFNPKTIDGRGEIKKGSESKNASN